MSTRWSGRYQRRATRNAKGSLEDLGQLGGSLVAEYLPLEVAAWRAAVLTPDMRATRVAILAERTTGRSNGPASNRRAA